ncbi:MAG: shikimate dehydrogenase [Paludibacteraceae bacterium]|nr:shikimate dehydrogenase [Paludibacteraceae bacterium]
MKFALIGHPVSHSFSAQYLNSRFQNEGIDAHYDLIDMPDLQQFTDLIRSDKYNGFNITIPHKKAIIPYLDQLSPEAAAIGAVNVIQIKDNKLIGHNTDIIGFRNTFEPMLKPNHTHAVILGTGGASQAVQYVFNKLNIPFRLVTHKELDTNTITKLAPIIINTTPLGMHPHTNTIPNIDYSQITPNHLIYDLVYNPTETRFLQLAKQQGATTQNGLAMLYAQADAALKIWLK